MNWIATDRGISKYDKLKQSLQYFSLEQYWDNTTHSINVWAFCEDDKGVSWVGTEKGLCRIDRKKRRSFKVQNGEVDEVYALCFDTKRRVLVGTNRGIFVANKINDSIYTLMPFELPNFSKFTAPIYSILCDSKGNIWFGVINKGIYRYDGRNVSNFLYKYKHPIFGDKFENYISDIIQDKNGNIWFSSWNGGGVWRYDGKDFKQFVPPISYYKTNQDKRGIVTTQGYLNFNSNNNSFIQSEDYISDDMIFSMTEDNLGNIWFATRNHGICYYNGKTFISIGSNKGFTSSSVSAILQDDKNNFWITTFDSGVWYYDGKIFKNFTENNGLVNNAVLNLVKDKDGNLWFGTKFVGLSRYDGKTFTTFSQYDN